MSPAVIRERGLRSFWIICQSEWNIDREKDYRRVKRYDGEILEESTVTYGDKAVMRKGDRTCG